jgi:hypothetical protein
MGKAHVGYVASSRRRGSALVDARHIGCEDLRTVVKRVDVEELEVRRRVRCDVVGEVGDDAQRSA